MEAAIDVETLAGAVVEEAVGDGADGFSDVGGLSHAALREEAIRYLFVINRFDFGDHVGADDAGLDLEDEDLVWGEAGGEGLSGHGEAGFRDAVVGTVDAAGEGRDGGDEDDTALLLFKHELGYGLGKEVGAFEIGGDEFVEAIGGGIEDVVTLAGSDAGVIDEEIDAPEFFDCEAEEGGAVLWGGNIALDDFGTGFGLEGLRGFVVAAVGGDYFVGFR